MPPLEGLSRQASAFAQESMLALSQMVSAQILLGYMKTLTLAPCTRHLFLRKQQGGSKKIIPHHSPLSL